MLATLAVAAMLAQAPMTPTNAMPVVRPLFAGEKWYQEAKAEEKLFTGVLEYNLGDGRIGLGARFNSFRLMAEEDGKPVIRQIHLSGKDQILSPFVGHNIKLTAKLVETSVEGGKLSELWPAQIEVLGLAPPGVIAEWKVLARASNWYPSRQAAVVPQPTVIRSSKHLADYMGLAVAGAVNAEERATSTLNTHLGNTKVDWSKHMLIIISGGVQRVGTMRVEITKITFGEKGLDVHWNLSNQNPAGNRPIEIVLVNKYDGDITFYQAGISRPYVIPAPAKPDKDADKPDTPGAKKTDDGAKKPMR